MKLTNTDGTTIDTNDLGDFDSLLLEKAKDLNDLCAAYKVPMFLVINHSIRGEVRPSTFFSVHHPKDDVLTVTTALLRAVIQWWDDKLPLQRLTLTLKEEVA